AFNHLADGNRLALLTRYEARLHLNYRRALQNLALARKLSVPNEPGKSLFLHDPDPDEPRTPLPSAPGPAVPIPQTPPGHGLHEGAGRSSGAVEPQNPVVSCRAARTASARSPYAARHRKLEPGFYSRAGAGENRLRRKPLLRSPDFARIRREALWPG